MSDPIEELRRLCNQHYMSTHRDVLGSAIAAYDAKCAELEKVKGELKESELWRERNRVGLNRRDSEMSQLTTALETSEAWSAALREALEGFMSGYDELDVDELRKKHKGQSAGECCAGDVVKGYDALRSTPAGAAYAARLKDAEQRIKDYEKQWVDMDRTISTCLQQFKEAEKKVERYEKALDDICSQDWLTSNTPGPVAIASTALTPPTQ